MSHKYGKLTKKELLGVIDSLEEDERDTNSTVEHVGRKIRELLEMFGNSTAYLNKLSLYDMGDELEEVTAYIEEHAEGDCTPHTLGHMLPECSSLGELNALRDDLIFFIDITPLTELP